MKTPVFLLLCLFSTCVYAQWDCPSRIGGSLKPLSGLSDNFTWATELITSTGYAGDLGISNAMSLVALDYSTNHITVYVEGGLKGWTRYGSDGYVNSGHSFGLREGFIQYRGNNQLLNLGLCSTKGDDPYLLNERVLGMNYQLELGSLRLHAITGTVQKQFARNGNFCTVGYLYNIVSGRERALLGDALGETSLALLTLTYKPCSANHPSDEFTTMETNESNGQSPKNSRLFKATQYGALLYHEYGSLISQQALFSGLFAQTELAGVIIKPEIILQSATSNQLLIWNLTLEKQYRWSNNQQTKFFGRYIGTVSIDSSASVLNSFSNVFAGEVLRLDALELPLLQVGIRHSVPRFKCSVKLQAALQTGQTGGYMYDPWGTEPTVDRMQEYDLIITKNIGDHWLLNAYAGYLIYPKMVLAYQYETVHTPWGKLEIRFTF